MVILHVHKGCIAVGFRKTVSATKDGLAFLIVFFFFEDREAFFCQLLKGTFSFACSDTNSTASASFCFRRKLAASLRTVSPVEWNAVPYSASIAENSALIFAVCFSKSFRLPFSKQKSIYSHLLRSSFHRYTDFQKQFHPTDKASQQIEQIDPPNIGLNVLSESDRWYYDPEPVPLQKPHEIDISLACLFNRAAAIDAIHVSIYENRKQDSWFNGRISSFG